MQNHMHLEHSPCIQCKHVPKDSLYNPDRGCLNPPLCLKSASFSGYRQRFSAASNTDREGASTSNQSPLPQMAEGVVGGRVLRQPFGTVLDSSLHLLVKATNSLSRGRGTTHPSACPWPFYASNMATVVSGLLPKRRWCQGRRCSQEAEDGGDKWWRDEKHRESNTSIQTSSQIAKAARSPDPVMAGRSTDRRTREARTKRHGSPNLLSREINSQ